MRLYLAHRVVFIEVEGHIRRGRRDLVTGDAPPHLSGGRLLRDESRK
jgi:hypothetical protein